MYDTDAVERIKEPTSASVEPLFPQRAEGEASPAEDCSQFQLGRTQKTVRGRFEFAAEPASPPPRHPELRERAKAFFKSLFMCGESRYALRVSRELLKLYHLVWISHPGLPRREIYRKVVMARTGSNGSQAEAVLLDAEHSFAIWPEDRDLRFSDVVHYLAVCDYLALDDRIATRTLMGQVVGRAIPQNL